MITNVLHGSSGFQPVLWSEVESGNDFSGRSLNTAVYGRSRQNPGVRATLLLSSLYHLQRGEGTGWLPAVSWFVYPLGVSFPISIKPEDPTTFFFSGNLYRRKFWLSEYVLAIYLWL